MSAHILRAFRNTEYRDMARQAIAAGWDAYLDGGGHVALVNPANGRRATLSITARGNGRQGLNARQGLIRAGLDLRGGREARRPAHTPEVIAMAETVATERVRPRPTGQSAGGKFALDGDWEILTLAGHPVHLARRADGSWFARTPDWSRASGRRQWITKDPDRAVLVARIIADLVAEPPVPARVAPAPSPAPRTNGHAPEAPSTWHAVQVEAGEFPMAAALDALDVAMAPALAALEAAGKADAAALLRAEMDRTAVESELLALYRRMTRGD